MWHSAREALSKSAFKEVGLWISEKNARAVAFFERAGFVRDPAATRTATNDGVASPEIRFSLALG
jgi:hypothetical protein